MEIQSTENSQQTPLPSDDASAAANLHTHDVAADASNHRDGEQDGEQDAEQKDDNDVVSREAEEVREALQAIASTGKFLHEWDNLKTMLSFQLKQVLSQYPEAKMTSEQQYASLGESYSELVNRLDEALTCFMEGPPFTLQRLCEILLDAKGIYPHLSKLALALEKNLLVTSTLTISSPPHPQTQTPEPDGQENANEKQMQQPNNAENGIEPPVADKDSADKDEVMAEADTSDDMTVDMEASEDAKPSETNSEPNANNA